MKNELCKNYANRFLMLLNSFSPRWDCKLRVTFFRFWGFWQVFWVNWFFGNGVDRFFGFRIIHDRFWDPSGGILCEKFVQSRTLNAFEHLGSKYLSVVYVVLGNFTVFSGLHQLTQFIYLKFMQSRILYTCS